MSNKKKRVAVRQKPKLEDRVRNLEEFESYAHDQFATICKKFSDAKQKALFLEAVCQNLNKRFSKFYNDQSDVELELKKRVSRLETVQKIHTATEFVLAAALLIHIILQAL